MDAQTSAAINRLAKQLADLQADVAASKRASGTPQLTNASITGGAVKVIDADGTHKGSIGLQNDGTFATVARNGPPPPRPSVPTISSCIAGLMVTWDGLFAEETTATRPLNRPTSPTARSICRPTPTSPRTPRPCGAAWPSPAAWPVRRSRRARRTTRCSWG